MDDSKNHARLLAMMLEMLGHETCYATTSRSGFEMMEYFQPEIVVSNLKMADADECDLVKLIRANSTNHHITLIAHTGLRDAVHQERAVTDGFDFYLIKPVEPETLVMLFTHIAEGKPLS